MLTYGRQRAFPLEMTGLITGAQAHLVTIAPAKQRNAAEARR